jgi:tRNA dimethylallyltransferase
MNKTCIIIVGPTAVGKTSMAIQIASHFGTEIISSDSRQCFTELTIGVAKPKANELLQVKHHFINSHSIHDDVNAAVFERYALKKSAEIFTQSDVVVMTGGTGLYVKAFCQGMDDLPDIDPVIRKTIITNYNNNGIEWLREQVKKEDPPYFIKGEIQNPQRLMRALEVKRSTDNSILQYQPNQKKQRDFNIIKIGIELPRPILTERINTRIDCMMQDGLLDEVKKLLPFQYLNALQTVGYKEIFAYLNGDTTLAEAITAIKISTRQYAKRQMTWFKKDAETIWCNPDFEEVLSSIKTQFAAFKLDT